jgi:hypothetical protein
MPVGLRAVPSGFAAGPAFPFFVYNNRYEGGRAARAFDAVTFAGRSCSPRLRVSAGTRRHRDMGHGTRSHARRTSRRAVQLRRRACFSCCCLQKKYEGGHAREDRRSRRPPQAEPVLRAYAPLQERGDTETWDTETRSHARRTSRRTVRLRRTACFSCCCLQKQMRRRPCREGFRKPSPPPARSPLRASASPRLKAVPVPPPACCTPVIMSP